MRRQSTFIIQQALRIRHPIRTHPRHLTSPFKQQQKRNMPASVDTSELPVRTTGAAAQLAAAHADEHPLKLYGGWFCPFVQRSWIVLHEKRIPHQYVEINPYHKDPDFLALNPRGLVPTLAVPVGDSGRKQRPLYESLVICEYLNEAYDDEKEYGPSLLPRDAYERARCRLWIDHIGNKIVPGFYRFIQHTPEKDYTIEQARENFLGHIKTLVKEMLAGDADSNNSNNNNESGPWFLGDKFSLVDVILAPWAKRLFLIDHYKPGGLGIPAAGQGGDEDEEKIWGRWRKWFDAITARQSVRDTWSDDERYVAAYRRYAEDTTNSEVAQATRKGEKLP